MITFTARQIIDFINLRKITFNDYYEMVNKLYEQPEIGEWIHVRPDYCQMAYRHFERLKK